MGPAERRPRIMKILFRRKRETISNLALEFGVSERTIRRDIEILSLTEPIYTLQGRYDGGVYVIEDSKPEVKYFDEAETTLIKKLIGQAGTPYTIDKSEVEILKNLLATYSKL